MKAESRQVVRFLSATDVQFVIPIYQRNYDWKIAQCKQLLDDIYHAGVNGSINEHFIGSIVYIQDDIYTTAEIREFVVIDGQQRITTLTLIYLALYQYAQNIKDEKLADKINRKYLINEYANDSSKLKLKATANNNEILQKLLRSKIESTKFSNIINNFNCISEYIKNNNYETIIKGLSKLMFVEIILDRSRDNPQRIFESLNSTGLALSQGDLIRNYILMGLEPKQQEQLYQDFWEIIETKAKCEINNENKVSDFIRDYLTLKNKKIAKKNAVYEEFKKTYPHFTFDSLQNELTTIVKLVKHYHKLINPKYETDIDIRLHLKYINQLEVTVSFPFLIQVYEDYSNKQINKTIFLQVIDLIQSFVWRRFIVSLPTNALNSIFMTLCSKIDINNYLTSIQDYLCSLKEKKRFPKDKETLDNLKSKDMYSIKNKNTRYLLDRLEHFNNNEPVDLTRANITVEHIFPQNPSNQWKQDLTTEDYEFIKAKYLNTISNLTLSGNNGKLGNKSFQEKRDLLEDGYKTSRLWLNKYLAGLNNWDRQAIEKRFDEISDRFLQIWQYPQIEPSSSTQINEEVNIFEAEDPTNKKLDYAIFIDEKIVSTNMVDFYVAIVKKLFEINPENLFSDDLKELKVTENLYVNKLRAPKYINPSYCFETHSSSLGKFTNIKKALEIYGLEDELFIKYQD